MAYQLTTLGNRSLHCAARSELSWLHGGDDSMRADQPQPEETNEVEV